MKVLAFLACNIWLSWCWQSAFEIRIFTVTDRLSGEECADTAATRRESIRGGSTMASLPSTSLLPAADDIYGYLSQQATDEFNCHNLALEE